MNTLWVALSGIFIGLVALISGVTSIETQPQTSLGATTTKSAQEIALFDFKKDTTAIGKMDILVDAFKVKQEDSLRDKGYYFNQASKKVGDNPEVYEQSVGFSNKEKHWFVVNYTTIYDNKEHKISYNVDSVLGDSTTGWK